MNTPDRLKQNRALLRLRSLIFVKNTDLAAQQDLTSVLAVAIADHLGLGPESLLKIRWATMLSFIDIARVDRAAIPEFASQPLSGREVETLAAALAFVTVAYPVGGGEGDIPHTLQQVAQRADPSIYHALAAIQPLIQPLEAKPSR